VELMLDAVGASDRSEGRAVWRGPPLDPPSTSVPKQSRNYTEIRKGWRCAEVRVHQ